MIAVIKLNKSTPIVRLSVCHKICYDLSMNKSIFNYQVVQDSWATWQEEHFLRSNKPWGFYYWLIPSNNFKSLPLTMIIHHGNKITWYRTKQIRYPNKSNTLSLYSAQTVSGLKSQFILKALFHWKVLNRHQKLNVQKQIRGNYDDKIKYDHDHYHSIIIKKY